MAKSNTMVKEIEMSKDELGFLEVLTNLVDKDVLTKSVLHSNVVQDKVKFVEPKKEKPAK